MSSSEEVVSGEEEEDVEDPSAESSPKRSKKLCPPSQVCGTAATSERLGPVAVKMSHGSVFGARRSSKSTMLANA